MLNSNYYYSKINSVTTVVKFFNKNNRIKNKNFNRYYASCIFKNLEIITRQC